MPDGVASADTAPRFDHLGAPDRVVTTADTRYGSDRSGNCHRGRAAGWGFRHSNCGNHDEGARKAGWACLRLARRCSGLGGLWRPADRNGWADNRAQRHLDFRDAAAAFAQQMIVDHQQAIAMAKIAQSHGQDPNVKQLAAQIEAEQAPEIQTMAGWLQAWGCRP